MKNAQRTLSLILVCALTLLCGSCALAEEKPFAGTTLNYITWRTDDQEALDYIHAKFFEETGITVNVEYNAGGQEHRTMVSTRMAANAVDMFAIDDGAEAWPYVKAGTAYEIDPSLEWLSRYTEGALSAGTYEGKLCSIPQCTSTMVFYYDKGYFDSLGLEAPKTWDDFMNVCQTILDAGERAPLVVGAGATWLPPNLFYMLFATTYPEQSPNFIADLENGTAKLTDERYQTVAGYIADMVGKGYLMEGSIGTDPNVAPNLVLNGMAAMSMEGSWRLYAYDAEGFELGMFIPQINENAYCVWPNQQNIISATSANKEACLAYFEFLSRPEISGYYCNKTAQVPVIKGVAMDDKNIQKLMELMDSKTAVMSPKMNATNNEVLNLYWDYATALLAGEDPMACAEEIQANISAAIG